MQEGFSYHHAEQSYVMLTFWIPEGPCMLPANASHQVGVGGFVVNEKNEVKLFRCFFYFCISVWFVLDSPTWCREQALLHRYTSFVIMLIQLKCVLLFLSVLQKSMQFPVTVICAGSCSSREVCFIWMRLETTYRFHSWGMHL